MRTRLSAENLHLFFVLPTLSEERENEGDAVCSVNDGEAEIASHTAGPIVLSEHTHTQQWEGVHL